MPSKGSSAETSDCRNEERPSERLSPHDLCEAAVTYVLEEVDTVQYMLQAIEEITGKPFLRQRIKCLPSVPQTYKDTASAATATERDRRLLHGQHAYAGYLWRRSRPDCDKGDVVLLEEHVAQHAHYEEKDGKEPSEAPETPAAAKPLVYHPRDPLPPDLKRDLFGRQSDLLSFVERNLRHELVHAFDDSRGKIEPLDCMHQACSEIRAARLSGDCFVWEELQKRRFDFGRGGLACVQRRARTALETNPLCRDFSERAIENVFDKCYSDYEPFAAPIYGMGSYGDVRFPNSTWGNHEKKES
ncbi:hypothetical protein STCU_00057 [Strigomonas culicis]|uniref:Mitochondrial inner membrane protease ATP23 n=1 Tax=Strigomonas culicis TaxID=28005 RepID=S9TWG8_9TRYP|nr:hypothetical protein STCU_08108 [Strigomonas culicis]EPY29154.1 hypothetical protein STCU_04698 [Strigomonas culicis]EPY35858.1 hypothetical protein STCU_00876 [Strigomonas culicis]EPY37240.1 hypothetical protein STCU_00057 [Strigomonas culicis]|eukprot:EPY22827.1 hypothetical protein STCU_08108 [Strigomonas culicis]